MTDHLPIRETWPCFDCGHKHFASQGCPDHTWTDSCPYEGLGCGQTIVAAVRVEHPAEEAVP